MRNEKPKSRSTDSLAHNPCGHISASQEANAKLGTTVKPEAPEQQESTSEPARIQNPHVEINGISLGDATERLGTSETFAASHPSSLKESITKKLHELFLGRLQTGQQKSAHTTSFHASFTLTFFPAFLFPSLSIENTRLPKLSVPGCPSPKFSLFHCLQFKLHSMTSVHLNQSPRTASLFAKKWRASHSGVFQFPLIDFPRLLLNLIPN